MVKFVTDFTSIVQFRHPYEMGGVYWFFSFVLTMGSLPVATVLTENKLTEQATSLAWTVVKVFIPFAVGCFAVFFKSIKKEYRHTFVSAKTASEFTMDIFRNSKNDENKSYIFGISKNHWVSIEDDVRKWVESNWERWEEEQPEWFDERRRSQFPVDWIPTTGPAKTNETRGRERNGAAGVDLAKVVPE
jgi:hypothetical protein